MIEHGVSCKESKKTHNVVSCFADYMPSPVTEKMLVLVYTEDQNIEEQALCSL